MLKNRRSATPTKDKSPSSVSGGDAAAPGSRKASSSSLTFFSRGPNRSSLNSDRFNANRSADGSATAGAAAFAASVPHWSDQGRVSLSRFLPLKKTNLNHRFQFCIRASS